MVAANSAPCLQCFYCLRGKVNLCEDLLFNNGAYAEYIRVPARIVERNTYEIRAASELSDAALAEPLACVVKGLEDTGLEAGRYGGGDRHRAHRVDVRPAREVARGAGDCDRAQKKETRTRAGAGRGPGNRDRRVRSIP